MCRHEQVRKLAACGFDSGAACTAGGAGGTGVAFVRVDLNGFNRSRLPTRTRRDRSREHGLDALGAGGVPARER